MKPTNGIDTQLFYRQELEKAIRDIRRDFETLHNAQRKEMEDYYNVKIGDMQKGAMVNVPGSSRQDELVKISDQLKSTKFDITDAQKALIQEKSQFKDLQDRLGKLEEEYNYVRDQRLGANETMNRDLNQAQDHIQNLTGEIDTILRRFVSTNERRSLTSRSF